MEGTKKINKGFLIFIIVLAILILIFIKEENQEKFNNLFNGLTSKDLELNLEKEYSGNNLGYFKGSLIKFEDSVLTYLDSYGDDIWIKDFGFVDPEIIYGNRAIYILDKAAGDIYALDNKGNTIGKHQLFKTIFNLSETNEGIIVHLKEQGEESLVMIDKDGNNLGEYIAQSNILTYDLNNDNSRYIFSSISLDNHIESQVNVNDMANNNKYSIKIEDEIVVLTQFIKNQLLIVTDSTVNIAQGGELKWSNQYPLIKDVYVRDNEIHLLYGDFLEVLDLNGESKLKIILGLEYNSIRPIGNFVVLYGNRNLMILDGKTEVIKYLADGNIVNVFGDEISLALKLEDKIQLLKFVVKETE